MLSVIIHKRLELTTLAINHETGHEKDDTSEEGNEKATVVAKNVLGTRETTTIGAIAIVAVLESTTMKPQTKAPTTVTTTETKSRDRVLHPNPVARATAHAAIGMAIAAKEKGKVSEIVRRGETTNQLLRLRGIDHLIVLTEIEVDHVLIHAILVQTRIETVVANIGLLVVLTKKNPPAEIRIATGIVATSTNLHAAKRLWNRCPRHIAQPLSPHQTTRNSTFLSTFREVLEPCRILFKINQSCRHLTMA